MFDISKFLPGFKSNTAAAEGNIGQLLSGQTSPANARNKAAYFGATSGMPNSGVSDFVGYDLFGKEAAANQQQGFQNFLDLIAGTSGKAFADPSQQFEQDRYQQEFQDRRRREDLARADAEAALQAARRPRQPNGLYRLPGQTPSPMGTSRLPVWAGGR